MRSRINPEEIVVISEVTQINSEDLLNNPEVFIESEILSINPEENVYNPEDLQINPEVFPKFNYLFKMSQP